MKTLIQPFHSLSRILNDSRHIALSDQYFGAHDLLSTQWHDDGNSFIVKVPVPGMSREDLSVHLEGRMLVISEKEHERNENNKGFRRSSVKHSITLPDGIDTARIQAKCRHGLLTITVDKKERTTRRIAIKVLGPASGTREAARLGTLWNKIKGKMNVRRLSAAWQTSKSTSPRLQE
jgi:HSP20 family molecular chaperone IbpA